MSVIFTFLFVALPERSLSPYLSVKSLPSIVTTLLSLAVTVKVTVSPSTTVLSGVIVNVGFWVSGASSTVTGTFTFSVDPSGYVTFTTASPTFPGLAVDGLLKTVSDPCA